MVSKKNITGYLTDLDWPYPENYLDYFMDYRIFEDSSDHLNNYWITGKNLTRLANQKDVHFIWGVFSAFDKNETVDLDVIKEEPYADGNPNFWGENTKIQHPKAVVELVLWDSTFILLLSKDTEFSKKFRNTFKGWKDLNRYNQS